MNALLTLQIVDRIYLPIYLFTIGPPHTLFKHSIFASAMFLSLLSIASVTKTEQRQIGKVTLKKTASLPKGTVHFKENILFTHRNVIPNLFLFEEC